MKDPRTLSISDFNYSLPPEKIAHYPLSERDYSKLLICDNEKIRTDIYRNIAAYLPEDSFMVFNNTKVIPARIIFTKPTGGEIEIFCLEPHEQYSDVTVAMSQKNKAIWYCLVGGASKWKPGQILEKKGGATTLFAKYLAKGNNEFTIELSWHPENLSFAEVLQEAGAIPLPPYIKREVSEDDRTRYQTVYAATEGSVAAPTAGLHFTEKIFKDLETIHAVKEYITLHVSAGTFKPVKSSTMEAHEMHAEWIEVSRGFILSLLENLEEIIVAVGTTSLRTIESLYWLGVKYLKAGTIKQGENPISLDQWEAYDLEKENIPVPKALLTLLAAMDNNQWDRLITKTSILIAPGYKFKIVNGLVTNFHQPQSTLLLLVAAFVGEEWKDIYEYALANDFHFLSYGDGCLLLRNQA